MVVEMGKGWCGGRADGICCWIENWMCEGGEAIEDKVDSWPEQLDNG